MIQRWLEHYDQAVPQQIGTYPSRTLLHFVSDRARTTPNATALVFKGRRISYGELHQASLAMAAALLDLGVDPGDRVALLLPNCPQFVVSELAAWRIGAIIAPQNPIYTERELEESLNTSRPRIIVTLSLFYPKVKNCQARTSIERVIVTSIKEYLPPALRILFTLFKEKKDGHRVSVAPNDVWFRKAVRRQPLSADVPLPAPEDPATILMSGGTTGTPKGVVSDHRALVMAGTQLAAWLREAIVDENAAILLPLPLYHTYGCSGAQSIAFITGTPLILVPDARDIGDLVKTIVRDRPTLACAVPTLLSAILNHRDVVSGKIRLRSLRACFSGAASLMAETKTRFEAITGCRVVEGYSLTEATMACCVNPYLGPSKIGSIGMPLPDVDVRIVDADDGRREVGPGEVGEITIRAPQLMRGYWRNPKETADVLRLTDDGLRLFTGDLGYIDEDGYVFLVDRKKDVIKTSGYQVWPREVEEVIASHPAVSEVGAAGLPDARKGEVVAAWVVPRPGVELTANELRRYCHGKLAPYKIPTHLEIRSSLPKTMIGKILRRQLVSEAKAAREPSQLVNSR